jgi:thiamine-monophosphate kinase
MKLSIKFVDILYMVFKEMCMVRSNEQKRIEIVQCIFKTKFFEKTPMQLMGGVEDADDCAVYDLPGNLSLVVGMDFVRGTKFTLFQEGYLDYFDVGYYLVVANLSDIAAMGATPTGLTTVIRYPDTLEDADFIRIVEGINEAASVYKTPVVGGDIGSYDEMVLVATAFGITEQGKYFHRRGTVEGDILCVTGAIGLPATALVYFTRAKKEGFALSQEEENLLINSWQRPVARIAEGSILARLGVVHACQDVSDGAKATIEQLGQASSIAFKIYESSFPIHSITAKVAAFLQVDPVALACSASVDFHLMFTISPNELEATQKALRDEGYELHAIGQAISNTETSCLVRRDGSESTVLGTAWKQQSGNVAQIILGK